MSAPRSNLVIRILFFYDVYAFTNEQLWYGVQWEDRSCSEMMLVELLQYEGAQALLDSYRKSSIPWRESHGYSINNGRLRFDASTALQLNDVSTRRRAKAKRQRHAPAAAAASTPMDLSSSDSDESVDDDAPLSTLIPRCSNSSIDDHAPLSSFVPLA